VIAGVYVYSQESKPRRLEQTKRKAAAIKIFYRLVALVQTL